MDIKALHVLCAGSVPSGVQFCCSFISRCDPPLKTCKISSSPFPSYSVFSSLPLDEGLSWRSPCMLHCALSCSGKCSNVHECCHAYSATRDFFFFTFRDSRHCLMRIDEDWRWTMAAVVKTRPCRANMSAHMHTLSVRRCLLLSAVNIVFRSLLQFMTILSPSWGFT